MSRDKQTGFHISKESVDKVFSKKDIDILGYESPITVIMGQMRMEQENNIYKAIQDYGVDVDKEELIKALQYDRNQYEKGYINGYNAKASDVAEEIEKYILEGAATIQSDNPDCMYGAKFAIERVVLPILEAYKKKYTEGK